MNGWTRLENIPPSERDAVVLGLIHGGYSVRLSKRKDGKKTVIDIEYRKESRT